MAVPSAVTRRRQQEEQSLRDQGIDPNAPPVATLNGDDTQQQTASTNGNGNSDHHEVLDEAQLRARVAELEQENRTNTGRSSTAQTELERTRRSLDAVQENRQFLERTMQEQQEQIDRLKAQLEDNSRQQTATTADRTLAEFADAPEP